ncbi:MAG: hypothetical protein V7629_03285 [Motiliproteus sp.]
MMRHDQQLQKIHSDLFDAFMRVDCDSHHAGEKAALIRNRNARRGIEVHFEQQQLSKNLAHYAFD